MIEVTSWSKLSNIKEQSQPHEQEEFWSPEKVEFWSQEIQPHDHFPITIEK
jgi:hypothetical protein